jgi:iron complex outermembrane receptor protein
VGKRTSPDREHHLNPFAELPADDTFQEALNGVLLDGQTYFLNPFGPSDEILWEYLRTEIPTEANYLLASWDFNASGKGFDWPGGTIMWAVGGEYRREELDDQKSPLNETGMIIGGRQVSSIRGDRDVFAAYLEFSIPMGKKTEIQLASRAENYSDFGSTLKPKLAVKHRLSPWMLLRASYGESFLAPNLPYLYASEVTTFSEIALRDPLRPADPPRQMPTIGEGNPDLQPEETETLYAGIVLEPKGFLEGLAIGIEWFQFDQTNLITRFEPSEILANEDLFPELVVRGDPDTAPVGPVNFLRADWLNVDQQTYRGWDFNLQYSLDGEKPEPGFFRPTQPGCRLWN